MAITIEQADNYVELSKTVGILQGEKEARDFAMFLANEAAPANILEIGTCSGGNFLLMHLCSRTGLRISIDMPWSERDPQVFGHQQRFYDACEKAGCRPVELIGNSHFIRVRAALHDVLAGKKLDLIFQDASHDYDGAKLDFEDYSPFLRPGGYYAQHDLSNGWPCGKFMREELFPRYKHWIFEDPANLFGIGVVQIP